MWCFHVCFRVTRHIVRAQRACSVRTCCSSVSGKHQLSLPKRRMASTMPSYAAALAAAETEEKAKTHLRSAINAFPADSTRAETA